MSDYFADLARLALGTAPSLAPRPTSRFDPVATSERAPQPDDPDGAADEAATPRPLEPAEAGRPPAAGDQRGPDVDVGVHVPPGIDAREDPEERGHAERLLIEPTDRPAPPEAPDLAPSRATVTSATAPQAPGPPRTVREPRAAWPGRSPLQPAVRPAQQTPGDGAPPPGRATPSPGPAVESGPASAEREAQVPSAAPSPGAIPQAIEDTPQRPSVRPRQSAESGSTGPPDVDARPAARRQSPPAPSTVLVTVGRVEVRAVQSPAPPSRPVAAPPAMTLDDYLATRDGGSP